MLYIIPIIISSISVISISTIGYYNYYKKKKEYSIIQNDIDDWIYNNSKKTTFIKRISRISRTSKE